MIITGGGLTFEITDDTWIVNGFECSYEAGCVLDYACLVAGTSDDLEQVLYDFDLLVGFILIRLLRDIIEAVQEAYEWTA